MGRRRFWIAAAVVAIVATGIVLMRREPPGQAALPATPGGVRQALFDAIQPLKVTNCELQRIGEAHDGGYLVCGNLLGDVKAAYSYGISGYDGWGCEISRRWQIVVHEYDCFDLREPACPDGEPVFHGECVGTARAVQDGRPFDTIAGQFAINGDAGRPVIVKMDVEGAEWDAFLLAPNSVFEHIDQLVVEFHHVEDQKYVAAIERLKRYFDIAHVHYNNFSCDPALKPFPAWAFEVLFVNKRIAKTNGAPAEPGPIEQDAPNNPAAADCQAAHTSGGVL